MQVNLSQSDGTAVKKPEKELRFGALRTSQLVSGRASSPRDTALWLAPEAFANTYRRAVWVHLSFIPPTAEWTHTRILPPYHPLLKKVASPRGIWHQLAKDTKPKLEPIKRTEPVDITCTVCTKPHTTGFIKESTNKDEAAAWWWNQRGSDEKHCHSVAYRKAAEVREVDPQNEISAYWV